MAYWLKWVLAIFLGRVALAASLPSSHGAEAILRYMDYLAEEEIGQISKSPDQPPKYEISASCTGKKGGRCDIFEFLLFSWSINGQKTAVQTRSSHSFSSERLMFRLFISQLSNKLLSASVNIKKPESGKYFNLVHAFSASVTRPDIQPSNYYAVTAQSGDKIVELQNLLAKRKPTERQENITKMGKAACQAAIDLRLATIEEYRLIAFEKSLGYKPVNKTIEIQGGFAASFHILDRHQNRIKYGNSDADERRIDDFLKRHAAETKVRKDHADAYEAVKSAGRRLGCILHDEA